MGQYTEPRHLSAVEKVYLDLRDAAIRAQHDAGQSEATIAGLPADRTYDSTPLYRLQRARAALLATAHPSRVRKAGNSLFISLRGEPLSPERIKHILTH